MVGKWIMRLRNVGVVVAFCTVVEPAPAEELTVCGYNVQSGGAAVSGVAPRIAAAQGCDIWGLSEVQNESWARAFAEAAEEGEDSGVDFAYILGATGRADRLAILYDRHRFEALEHFELTHINVGGRVRAPLVVRLRDRVSEQEFYFMVNHLYRSRASQRHLQARLLNEWARNQSLPVIAVGDYNFDWRVEDGETDHDEGFDALIGAGEFAWVRPPAPLVKSQCSTTYNSVLDFVFVAGAAQGWAGVSEIVVVPGDCPDDETTSDHRPVRATFDLPNKEPLPTDSRGRMRVILERVSRLEGELRELRQLIEQAIEQP